MDFCPRCMRTVSGPHCPYCNADVNIQNSSDQLPVGAELQGNRSRYQVGVALGQGGFGITYIARDCNSGQRVAVKEFFPVKPQWVYRSPVDHITTVVNPGNESAYNKGRMSFLKEAQVLSTLENSPAEVVKGIDYMEINNTAYLVMEYIEGPTLGKLVQMNGKLSASELLPRMRPLLEAISWLHKLNPPILHRDLSPANIIWTPNNVLKVIDFGSARFADGSVMTGYLSPDFAPVEQWQSSSNAQGSWTDVYTIAASIYFALTGQKPPASRVSAFFGDIPDPLQSPISLGADISPEQEKVLLHAMEIKPKDRIRTMDEFISELYSAAPVRPNDRVKVVITPEPPTPTPIPPQPVIPTPPQPEPKPRGILGFLKSLFGFGGN